MKISVIGGGSSYAPELAKGLLQSRLDVREVWLVDVAEGLDRAQTVAALMRRMATRAGRSTSFTVTTDRERAIAGSSFVLNQFRVGGLRMRGLDERVPLRHGVVGQETTGPGGFASAMRTIRVAREVAEQVDRLAQGAWLLNFTNPAGLITQALHMIGAERTLGLCNIPRITERRLSQAAGTEVELSVAGLNHLTGSWASANGTDITQTVLRHPDATRAFTGEIPYAEVPEGFLAQIGFIPNPYLSYFFFPGERLRTAVEQALSPEGTRADRVQRIEADLFAKYREEDRDEPPEELLLRGGAFYSEVAVDVMAALLAPSPVNLVLNIPNAGAIADLDDGDVVERNALVSRDGIRTVPLPGRLPPVLRGLVQRVKEYERLTAEAALGGSRRAAFQALLAHPLVPGASVAQKLLVDLEAANQGYWPELH